MRNKLAGLFFFLIVMFSISTFSEAASWQTKADTLVSRDSVSAVAINNKIYVCGTDSYAIDEFDPVTNTWTFKTNIPNYSVNQSIAAVNGKIYIIGHTNAMYSLQMYDPVENTWQTKKPMNYPRINMGVVVLNDKIYAIGGYGSGNTSNTLEMYDTVTDTWVTKAPMLSSRYYFAASVANGKIYVFGGTGGPNVSNQVEEYNPDTNTWVQKQNMPVGKRDIAATTINNKIYIIGGNIAPYVTPAINEVVEYEPLTEVWTPKESMPTSRAWLGAVTLDNAIYTIGGRDGIIVSRKVEVYNPSPQLVAFTLTATGGDSKVNLNWNSVSGTTDYIIMRSTVQGGNPPGTYETIVSTGIVGTSFTDNTVTNGVTYYYIVLALSKGTQIGVSNEAFATPTSTTQPPPSGGKGLLRINFIEGSEKEFEMTVTELSTFLDWYDKRSSNNGPAYYVISKKYNLGPFISRKDYIAFDKILNFETLEY